MGVVLLANYVNEQKITNNSRADEYDSKLPIQPLLKRSYHCGLKIQDDGSKDYTGNDCNKCGALDFTGKSAFQDNNDEGCDLFCTKKPGDAPLMCPRAWTEVSKCSTKNDNFPIYSTDPAICAKVGCNNTTCAYKHCDQDPSYYKLTQCPKDTYVNDEIPIPTFAPFGGYHCGLTTLPDGTKDYTGNDCDKCGAPYDWNGIPSFVDNDGEGCKLFC